MADLEGLMRLRRNTVEEKQKILADLFRNAEKLQKRKDGLVQKLKKEREAIDNNPELETLTYFGAFEQVVLRDIDRLTEELKKWELRIQIAQDAVREAFADLKRVEIVDRRRKEEDSAEFKAKETRELDEIGLEVFRRNED
ncbi:MAG: hypothetical protein GW903_01060 [Alphaproteobacteria bacterium]|nr:hypothetical protein [Alphaproteobacteria bacterium]NCQ87559.1 hypothetical protein [Alphaproteobacteria bacterium]NCT06427.1 hypothetical protein [Alphaproteobacteria bacterium]